MFLFKGSTIEMLRSENVQVRSQLSSIQRRMFQEKQQIIDYLHQIENDIIEKERLKQHELLLRQDNEQLKSINNKYENDIKIFQNTICENKNEFEQLKNDYSLLLETLENKNCQVNNIEKELVNYKNILQQLYSHFNINIHSIDQLICALEDKFDSQLTDKVFVLF